MTRPLAELLDAFAHDQIACCFQPIVAVHERRILGVEALARWEHPAAGTLQPGAFVPQIEAAGLAAELLAIVMRHAFRSLGAAFFAAERLSLAVNVTLDQLLDPATLRLVAAECRAASMAPEWLTIEMTEESPVRDVAALAAAMAPWLAAGFPVVIDDVVPETLNLAGLLQLGFSAIKLDRSVVQGAPTPALQATVGAARQNGLRVVAEGVEDAVCWGCMAGLGVDGVQGFLVSGPLPAAELPAWLSAWRSG